MLIDLKTPGLGYRISPTHLRPGPGGNLLQAGYGQTTYDFLATPDAPRVDLAVNTVAYYPFPLTDGSPGWLSEPVWGGNPGVSAAAPGAGDTADRPDPNNPSWMLGLLPGRAVIGEPAEVRAASPAYAFGSFVVEHDGKIPHGIAVKDGEPTTGTDPAHARTAVGVSHGGRVVILVVADGYHPGVSEGLSASDTGKVLRAAGAVRGMFLDGGGSSTLVARDPAGRPALLNRPAGLLNIPGTLRPVAANLGFTNLRRGDDPLPAIDDWRAAWTTDVSARWLNWYRVRKPAVLPYLLASAAALAGFLGYSVWRRRRSSTGRPEPAREGVPT